MLVDGCFDDVEHLKSLGLHIVFADEEPSAAAFLSMFGADAIAIRPDRYTLGQARSSDEMAMLCRGIRSLLSPQRSNEIDQVH